MITAERSSPLLQAPTQVQVWTSTNPLPPRSTLYHLEPIGIGTPFVESLSSYIGRLADAHAVPSFALIKYALFPHMRVSHTLYKLTEFAHLSLGTTPIAEAWATAVESLTERRDIRSLTLLPWATLINSCELLHKTQFWCSYCYRDWRTSGLPIYNPLLWSIAVVTTCPQHQRRLQHQCPNSSCKRSLPLLSPRYRAGHCSYCCQWLGDGEAGSPQATFRNSLPDHAQQTWITNAVGEMLSETSANPGRTPHDQFHSSLQSCLAHHAEGKICRLAHLSGASEQALSKWLRRQSSICLSQLLNLCYHFNVTPVQFLASSPAQIAEFQLHLPTLGGNIFPKASRISPLSHHPNKQRLARCLLLDTSAVPPLTIREIGKELGVSTTALIKYFPNESNDTIRRCKEWRQKQTSVRALKVRDLVREEILSMRKQGITPKKHIVARNLKMPFFPLRPIFNAAWEEVSQEV